MRPGRGYHRDALMVKARAPDTAMKSLLLEIKDWNMADSNWTWSFFLNKTANGRFTVSGRHANDGLGIHRPAAGRGLKDGVEVLNALHGMLDEACYRLGDFDLKEIVSAIKRIDVTLAADFATAPEGAARQDAAGDVGAEELSLSMPGSIQI